MNKINQLIAFIKYHYQPITLQQLDDFCVGGYISYWQFKWIARFRFNTWI